MNHTAEAHDETLAQRLARGPIEPRAALDILEQLLTALEPVHSGGAVHRHITPEVIFITADGRATLTGFERMGASGGPAPGVAGKMLDHPQYKAPEQFHGDPVDARADIFALGVSAHEMLTGSVSGYNHSYDGKAHGATLVSAKGARGESLNSLVVLGGQTYTHVPGGPARWTFWGIRTTTVAVAALPSSSPRRTPRSTYLAGAASTTGSLTERRVRLAGVLGESLSGLLSLGANFSSVGTHTATWTFAGSANYNSDSGTVTIKITEPPTTSTAPPG